MCLNCYLKLGACPVRNRKQNAFAKNYAYFVDGVNRFVQSVPVCRITMLLTGLAKH